MIMSMFPFITLLQMGDICDELEHNYYYDKNKDDFVYIYDGIFDDCDEDDSDN